MSSRLSVFLNGELDWKEDIESKSNWLVVFIIYLQPKVVLQISFQLATFFII